jgi:multiple sugar transport system ATP-binding protein
MAGVVLKGVGKYFGKIKAVDETDLEIEDGEFLVLVGPSGCGKSTLLRMIAGLETPTSGEIYIADRNVTNMEPKNRNVSMVFQDYALYPHMKVFGNMAFGLRLQKTSKPEIEKRVREAARLLGIEHYLDRYPKQLSGGQRQRVALGRAIVRHPQVFLMDEPLSNLDAKLRVHMRAELIKLHQKLKATFIYVTHDQIEALTMGSRIAVIDNGVIQQLSTPDDIYQNPINRFVAGFIGSPPINFLQGAIRKEDDRFLFYGKDLKLELPKLGEMLPIGDDLTLGIRPECFNVAEVDEGATDRCINTTLEVVENIGSENIVYLKTLGGEEIVMKTNKQIAWPSLGSNVRISPNYGNINIFGPAGDSVFSNEIICEISRQ